MRAKAASSLILALSCLATIAGRSATADDEAGFVREWLVCGPFPHAWDEGRLAFDPLHGEASQNPSADRFAGGEKWRLVLSPDMLDFNGEACGFAIHEHALCYAHVYVKSEKERTLTLSVGSDDGFAAWVNGERAAFEDTARGWKPDQNKVPVSLKQGWNRVLFKVSQGVGDWALSARFLDGDEPAKGLEISATNPDPDGAFASPRGAPDLRLVGVAEGEKGILVRLLNVGGIAQELFVQAASGKGEALGARVERKTLLQNGEVAAVTLSLDLPKLADLAAEWQVVWRGARGEERRLAAPALGAETVLRLAARVAELPALEQAVEDAGDARALFPERIPEKALEPLLAAVKEGKKEALAEQTAKLQEATKALAVEARKTKLFLLGNAHIDMAWLWRWDETVHVCHDTYAQALAFMEEFEDFKYIQSSAQTYAWMEEKFPDLFREIQKRAKEGRWEVTGGTWVECDNNMPSGEAHCRQLLHGKRWFQEKLGVDVTVGWMPDSFGFAWTLPQIYRRAGISTFLTTKLDWADATRWNERVFRWEGPDGSRLLVAVPRDGYDKQRLDRSRIATVVREETRRADLTAIPYMYGVGDHGGGPTREAIGDARLLQKKRVFPETRLSTAKEFFEELAKNEPKTGFPVWKDELYLEYHRGVATSQEPQKRQNRRAERLLGEAERFSACAALVAEAAYPTSPLEKAWKTALFNQFHDILPGSGIRAVYEDSAKDYDVVFRAGESALDEARTKLLAGASVPKVPKGAAVVVWNALPWERSEVVRLPLLGEGRYRARSVSRPEDISPVQTFERDGRRGPFVVFFAAHVPAMGYAVFTISPEDEDNTTSLAAPSVVWEKPDAIKLENGKLRVVVDRASGELLSVVDLASGREVLEKDERGNVLEALDDRPPYFDAWEVTKPIVHGKPLGEWFPAKVSVVAKGPVRAWLLVERTFRHSTVNQSLILDAGSPRLDIETYGGWHDHHVLLKAAFPLAAKDKALACAIPFGTIERPTLPETPAEAAKFEVNAHEFVDLSQHEPEAESVAVQVDLSKHFEGRANTDDAERSAGGFDAQGRTFPREELPEEAKALGAPFVLARAPKGAKDFLSCHGQRIEVLAGSYDEVLVAGASTEGDEAGVLEVEGPGGERTATRLWLTDWCGKPVRRDAVLVACEHRHTPAGDDAAVGNRPTIWVSPVSLSRRTEVRALVLPDRPRMKILAIVLVKRPGQERKPIFGASLLSDTKYGFDARGSRVRVSLLRSPSDPDPKADEGEHRFTYSLHPHEGGWREALTVRRGEELASPLVAFTVEPHEGDASARGFLSVEPASVELAAFKGAEDGKGFILRLVERHGRPVRAQVRLPGSFAQASDVDLIERPVKPVSPTAVPILRDEGKTLLCDLGPWEIRTVLLVK